MELRIVVCTDVLNARLRDMGGVFLKKIFLFCMGICIMLIGCDVQKSDILPMKDSVINESKDNSRREERQNEFLETIEDSSETLPFQVEIDKTSLQIRKEKEATATILTKLDEWGFTAQTKYGKISNIGKDSFDYIAPKDEEKLEDVIVIFLTDYNSGTRYECSIPIIFLPTRDTVISN